MSSTDPKHLSGSSDPQRPSASVNGGNKGKGARGPRLSRSAAQPGATPDAPRDRLPIVILSAILGALAIAFLVRALSGQADSSADSRDRVAFDQILVPVADNPRMFGFTRDPRDAMPRYVRIRPPGHVAPDRKPMGRSQGWERGRPPKRPPPAPLAAWTPRPATPIPRGAKYPEDPPPKRSMPLLRVLSEPPGLPVEIDGVRFGATPVSRPVATGKTSVEVRILGRGFEDVRKVLRPDAEGNFLLSVAMTRTGMK